MSHPAMTVSRRSDAESENELMYFVVPKRDLLLSILVSFLSRAKFLRPPSVRGNVAGYSRETSTLAGAGASLTESAVGGAGTGSGAGVDQK